MNNPRISLFLTSLSGGGAERIMLTLAEGLADRGFIVDLVVTNARGALLDEVPDNVRLVDLNAGRIMASLIPLVKYLRRERPEAFLSALTSTNCIAVWARALARVPLRLILSQHNTQTQKKINSATLRGRLLPTIMRFSYPLSDGFVAVSSGVAADLASILKCSKEDIHVIYNPVVTPSMLSKSYEPVQHPWFNDGEPPVILGIGRLTNAKDFPLLIHSFSLLLKQKEARLMILGEGEERSHLEALVDKLGLSSHVALPGYVKNPYAYMRHASLFVLSSRWEGLPTVLIEAMACGTNVVSTDCPSGPSEILGDKYRDCLSSVGDPYMLSEKMLHGLLKKKDNMEGGDSRFTIDSALDGYLSALELNQISGTCSSEAANIL